MRRERGIRIASYALPVDVGVADTAGRYFSLMASPDLTALPLNPPCAACSDGADDKSGNGRDLNHTPTLRSSPCLSAGRSTKKAGRGRGKCTSSIARSACTATNYYLHLPCLFVAMNSNILLQLLYSLGSNSCRPKENPMRTPPVFVWQLEQQEVEEHGAAIALQRAWRRKGVLLFLKKLKQVSLYARNTV